MPRSKITLRPSAEPRSEDKKLFSPAGNPIMTSSYGSTDYLCPHCLDIVISGDPPNIPVPKGGRRIVTCSACGGFSRYPD
jgi:hypothetical protein